MTIRRIAIWLILTLIIGALAYVRISWNSSRSEFVNSNARIRVTKSSKVYLVNSNPACYFPNCTVQNNIQAYGRSNKSEALEWIALGIESVDRFLSYSPLEPGTSSDGMLLAALKYFEKATEADPTCPQAYTNLGLVQMNLNQFKNATNSFKNAIQYHIDSSSKAATYIFLGLTSELLFDPRSEEYYQLAFENDPDTTLKYYGIYYNEKSEFSSLKGGQLELQALKNIALWSYFSPISVANYGLLDPDTSDSFIENRYAVLRKIVPPFVLQTLAKYYSNKIQSGTLRLGDGQSHRYVSYNDRPSRYIHFQLVDYVRKVVAHNAKPTYSYFGGYRPGADLKPHVDREQCEFTLSLSIEQDSSDEVWLLSLGKKPLFDTVRSYAKIEYPPEDEIVDAALYAGDGLLFMGRHLVHFRRGILQPGKWVHQVFLHFVQEDFKGDVS